MAKKKLSEALEGKYEITRKGLKPGTHIFSETGGTRWDFTTMGEREANALIKVTGDKYLKKTEKPKGNSGKETTPEQTK